ncbi:uncharacterized protein DAT39_015936 [Clarias magur]|uniref:Uncharacterized protein n=1 Tax=Clarias magur TaxID=1594786 RepID=A0A8J4WWE7_CLAMG|nr:uncharacterized protein DAT39_015936 [Clarias magur]
MSQSSESSTELLRDRDGCRSCAALAIPLEPEFSPRLKLRREHRAGECARGERINAETERELCWTILMKVVWDVPQPHISQDMIDKPLKRDTDQSGNLRDSSATYSSRWIYFISRGFQETREKKCIARASTESIQTAKNLQIRRRTLLKSKGEWVSAPESQDERRGQPRFTSSFSLRFPSAKGENYRANIRLATKLRINDL